MITAPVMCPSWDRRLASKPFRIIINPWTLRFSEQALSRNPYIKRISTIFLIDIVFKMFSLIFTGL